jgi:Fic family protein
MDRIKVKLPPNWAEVDPSVVFKKYTAERTEMMEYIEKISENNYMHWERARFINPPVNFSKTEAWYLAREIRKISAKLTPVKEEGGEPFTILRPNYTDKLLRYIDMYAGGHFLFDQTSETAKAEKQKYLTRGIIEEAIASSQLEGASTTRKYAKKMIAENKKPKNKSEWMIFNNYKTLQAVEENYKNADLSMDMLLELQSTLTENTLDSDESGRFRKDSDNIVVTYAGKIAHIPPKAAFVKKELNRLIKYANDSDNFVHPAIKAVILHFWIGYLHPFVDGNGRLARTIFYWYMLKNDYWAIAYLPISMVIKRAPRQYTYSYIYTEQDNLDLTYFFDYHIKKIVKTIDEFREYVDRIQNENKEVEAKLQAVLIANDRQKQSIHFLLSDPGQYLTITSHQNMNGISRGTARTDILSMEKKGLLRSIKVGRNVRFYASDKLKKMI